MKYLILCLALFVPMCFSQTLDPLVDYRATNEVSRNSNGKLLRNPIVVVKFKSLYACPSTGKNSGACAGWAVDHVIPLACGGVDAVYNMQWLPLEIKNRSGEFSKDHFERRIYGGQGLSPGCP